MAVLASDQGTSATKAVVVADDGSVIGLAEVPVVVHATADGGVELDADALGSAGYTALKSPTQVRTDTCLKVGTRSGSRVYQPCTVALNESIRMQDGQINRVTCAFNGNNRLTRAS